jgi:hypothetical protein
MADMPAVRIRAMSYHNAVQQSAPLLDHLVGDGEKLIGNLPEVFRFMVPRRLT